MERDVASSKKTKSYKNYQYLELSELQLPLTTIKSKKYKFYQSICYKTTICFLMSCLHAH